MQLKILDHLTRDRPQSALIPEARILNFCVQKEAELIRDFSNGDVGSMRQLAQVADEALFDGGVEAALQAPDWLRDSWLRLLKVAIPEYVQSDTVTWDNLFKLGEMNPPTPLLRSQPVMENLGSFYHEALVLKTRQAQGFTLLRWMTQIQPFFAATVTAAVEATQLVTDGNGRLQYEFVARLLMMHFRNTKSPEVQSDQKNSSAVRATARVPAAFQIADQNFYADYSLPNDPLVFLALLRMMDTIGVFEFDNIVDESHSVIHFSHS